MSEPQRDPFSSPLLLSDADVLALGVPPESIELFRRKSYQARFGVATWAERLSEFTFRTHCIPLSWKEANAIVSAFYKMIDLRTDHRARFAASAKEVVADNPPTYSGGLGTVSFADLHAALDEPTNHTLSELAARLDETLHEQFGERGAFVKLNTRSPKDVPIYNYEDVSIQQLVREEIARLPIQSLQSRDPNAFTNAFVRATNRCMRMTNGEQILQTLILSSRVSEDLNRVIGFGERLFETVSEPGNVPTGAEGVSIVFREWRDAVIEHPYGELRGFVHENQLNALTQYFSFVCFEEFQDAQFRAAVERAVRKFFDEHCRDALRSHQSYVIDFCVIPRQREADASAARSTEPEFEIVVIELNPFHSGAGAGLFSWREHRNLFMHGPFEFRVVRRADMRSNPMEVLPMFWQRFLMEEVSALLGEPFTPGEPLDSSDDGVVVPRGVQISAAVLLLTGLVAGAVTLLRRR